MRTILITGSSSGFGKELVKQLSAKRHYQVIATLRKSREVNKEVAGELSALPNVEVAELDVTDDAQVSEVVQQALSVYKHIDVLINNAGVFGGGLLEAHSLAQVHKLFDVNVYGPLRLMNAVLPSMRKRQEGLIINMSSMLGFFSIPLNAVYCASKFALEALVTGSYDELIQKGVENILVEPGSFPTELYEKPGIVADLKEVTASYDGMAEQMKEYASAAVYHAIISKQPKPRAVVDKLITLIEMERGTRPVRNPIDHISGDDFARQVAEALQEMAAKQMKAYGF